MTPATCSASHPDRAMIATFIRRGLVAGLFAGILAGLVGLTAGGPSLDTALDLQTIWSQQSEAAGNGTQDATLTPGTTRTDSDTLTPFTRGGQRAGTLVGISVFGVTAGALFALLALWAVGRVTGDGWARSLKLGTACVLALVLLPALVAPPIPPGAGNLDETRTRLLVHLLAGCAGLVLAWGTWAANHLLVSLPLARPWRHTLLGGSLIACSGLLLLALPQPGAVPSAFPAELLWEFRLGAVATQVTLVGALAVCFGLLGLRDDQQAHVWPAPGGTPGGRRNHQ